MGLDTTHNCWHGAYSAFHRWRTMIAESVAITLGNMEGFGGEMRWPSKEIEPLVVLLDHSDCEGEIAWQDCGPLADRLEQILPTLPASDWGHMADPRAKTRQFIDGLRAAAAAQENVGFY